ncbi:MAG: oligopeptide/dipeptide ABC transporter ATP-binding protein, partial [Actinomycetota bacterium]|nr:oligopeptide/dipeptide ABC transporter ATP-binding protein [Actinomycetota bacterium]
LLDDLRAERGMSMILVTHDLGVVKGRTDEVMVMYAGRTMEEASTEEIFSQQGHPYTEALIETIPKINSAGHTRLMPIPGQPPVTTSPPTGCPFADRCRYTTDRCVAQGPLLEALGDDHQVACHTPVGTPAAAAALAANAARGHTAAGLEIHHSGVPVGAVADGPVEQA